MGPHKVRRHSVCTHCPSPFRSENHELGPHVAPGAQPPQMWDNWQPTTDVQDDVKSCIPEDYMDIVAELCPTWVAKTSLKRKQNQGKAGISNDPLRNQDEGSPMPEEEGGPVPSSAADKTNRGWTGAQATATPTKTSPEPAAKTVCEE